MSSTQTLPLKKSKGRQKVRMVKMENENNLQVTFSKRRAGLFKKASELCTLCGVEATIIVFSPGNKVFCFGHPNVETITNRFLHGVPSMHNNGINQMIIEAHRNSTIRNLNLELTQLERQMAIEKKRGDELDMVRKTGQMQKWYPPSIEDFNYEQLLVLKNCLLNFKKDFDVEMHKRMQNKLSPSSLPFYPNPIGNQEIYPGSGSSFDFPSFNPQLSFGYNNSNPYSHSGINITNNLGSYQPPYRAFASNDHAFVSYNPTANVFMTNGSSTAMPFVGRDYTSMLPIGSQNFGNRD